MIKFLSFLIVLAHSVVLFWAFIFYKNENYVYAFWSLFFMVFLNMFHPFVFELKRKKEL